MPLSEWSVQASEAKDKIMPFTSCTTQCATGYTATAPSLTLWHKDHKDHEDHEVLQAFLLVWLGLTILAPGSAQKTKQRLLSCHLGSFCCTFEFSNRYPRSCRNGGFSPATIACNPDPCPAPTGASWPQAVDWSLWWELAWTGNWCPDALMNLVPSNSISSIFSTNITTLSCIQIIQDSPQKP